MRGSLRDEFNLLIKLIVSIQIRPEAENKIRSARLLHLLRAEVGIVALSQDI